MDKFLIMPEISIFVFLTLEAPKRSFLGSYKISMILAAKHRKKSHFDSLVLLVLMHENIIGNNCMPFSNKNLLKKEKSTCPICKNLCLEKCIECDQCQFWDHFKCAKVISAITLQICKALNALENHYYSRLTTLQERRVRGDMIQLFKFYRGVNAVRWVKPMEHCSSLSQAGPAGNTRGHRRRLSGQVTTKCQQRANFFINRVFNEWNALPCKVSFLNLSLDFCAISYHRWLPSKPSPQARLLVIADLIWVVQSFINRYILQNNLKLQVFRIF
ncbi:RNA-directed DNA polymerase from mobile element jockey-like [Brachionus plicatilis]|uniref:RNA-directed DNA polymerase from mobile element jockey-like n=1 Tax=Brachionus plicatilis TaxID=10195 RepID=A0A3M7Q9M5_BRAPC|nr:RNA-directed DNA polymerase from mobile element jockey-like [Brachionus plicatilis]